MFSAGMKIIGKVAFKAKGKAADAVVNATKSDPGNTVTSISVDDVVHIGKTLIDLIF